MPQRWKNTKVRLDIWDRISGLAREQSRSVAGQIDMLLRGALDQEPGNLQAKGEVPEAVGRPAAAPVRAFAHEVPAGPQPSPPSDETSSALRGRDVEAGVNGGGGADQITVDEAITRCPVCNDSLDEKRRCVDPDCASHRVAS